MAQNHKRQYQLHQYKSNIFHNNTQHSRTASAGWMHCFVPCSMWSCALFRHFIFNNPVSHNYCVLGGNKMKFWFLDFNSTVVHGSMQGLGLLGSVCVLRLKQLYRTHSTDTRDIYAFTVQISDGSLQSLQVFILFVGAVLGHNARRWRRSQCILTLPLLRGSLHACVLWICSHISRLRVRIGGNGRRINRGVASGKHCRRTIENWQVMLFSYFIIGYTIYTRTHTHN